MELADNAANPADPLSLGTLAASAGTDGPESPTAAYVPDTLKVRLRREKRLSIDRCVELGLALAGALAQLHEQGLVHRDIKPANIIFVRGEPKLADIGLVTARDTSRSLVGTIGYIPPEGAGSTSADLFSLGRVLYESSTGKPVEQYPEPAINLALDEIEAWAELNEIVLRACQPVASARYPSARAMREDLERLKAGVSIRRLREAERRMSFFRKVGAVSAALALVIATGWIFQAREAGRFRALAQENLERLRQLHVATGLRAMDQGDLSTALVWLSEALNLTLPPTGPGATGQRAVGSPVSDETLQRGRWEAIWRQCPRILRIGAHDGPVPCAMFGPRKRRVLTASLDGTACVWDLADGKVIWRFRQEQPLTYAAFAPDGQRIVTCCEDGAARVWNLATGALAFPPLTHPGKVLHAAFSPDNRRLVTCGADGTVKLWEATSGELIRLVFSGRGEVNYVEFSPDGCEFVTACDANIAQVWDAISGAPIGAAMEHPDDVRQARFSPDGKRVVTACRDGIARVFKAQTGALVLPPMKHTVPLLYASFDPTGHRIVAGGGSSDTEGEVRLWNARTGELLARPAFLNVRSRISRFSPDGRYVATGTQSKGLYLWDAETGRQVAPAMRHNQAVWDVQFSADGHQILSAARDGAWRLWELAVGSALDPVWHHPAAVNDARWLKDGKQVLVRGFPHSSWQDCGVWDPGASTFRPVGDPFSKLPPFEMPSSGKKWLAGWSNSGDIVLRDIESGRVVRTLPCTNEVAVLAISLDDHWILTTDRGQSARLWEVQTGTPIEPTLGHNQSIVAGVFSPNSQIVITGTGPKNEAPGPGQIWIWATATRHLLTPPLSVDGTPVLAVSPDNRRILAGTKDLTPKAHFAQLIDLSSGRALGPKLWHSDGVACVQFSPDGHKLVTAGEDGGCRVWDAETGRPITPWLLHKRSVSTIAFAPDGRRMVTACVDGSARIWDAQTGKPARTMGAAFAHSGGQGRPLLGPPEGLVLDGREHDGRLACVGADSDSVMLTLVVDR